MFYGFRSDKLILKVVAQSEALLILAELEPEFVSQNDNDGRIESAVIFPLGYTSISEEEMEAEMDEAEPEAEAASEDAVSLASMASEASSIAK